ncbi:MAG: hypothetical protein D6695_09570 [Planctomycetota bacterium]|nr:MAG: hypothetical protein D6695_09570 [Planctomycetota bacterium]
MALVLSNRLGGGQHRLADTCSASDGGGAHANEHPSEPGLLLIEQSCENDKLAETLGRGCDIPVRPGRLRPRLQPVETGRGALTEPSVMRCVLAYKTSAGSESNDCTAHVVHPWTV